MWADASDNSFAGAADDSTLCDRFASLIDDAVSHATRCHPIRQREPQPILAESEVLTMEVAGAYLGLMHDSAMFAYFRQHYAHFFPALALAASHDLCASSRQPVATLAAQRTAVAGGAAARTA